MATSESSCSSALPRASRSTPISSKRIKAKIRTGASPRHVPARIVAIADIPRTKSGKITELAVRDIVHGREVKNREALANPAGAGAFPQPRKAQNVRLWQPASMVNES